MLNKAGHKMATTVSGPTITAPPTKSQTSAPPPPGPTTAQAPPARAKLSKPNEQDKENTTIEEHGEIQVRGDLVINQNCQQKGAGC